MNTQIKQQTGALLALRDYAISKNIKAAISLHQEDSHLLRLANSGVSLNTSEQLCQVSVVAYGQKKTASASVLCDLGDQAKLFATVDKAGAMLAHASPRSYQPSFPAIEEDSITTTGYDQALANISNQDILAYVEQATAGLLDEDVVLSGNFSVGATLTIHLSTQTPHCVVWLASDAQITLVLASQKDKWEISAEQSASHLGDLDPKAQHQRLSFLKAHYQQSPAVQLPLGSYTVVFGPAAIAEYLHFLEYLGTNGGGMMRDNSISKEEDIGQKCLSSQVTLLENPSCLPAFAIPVDQYGRRRTARALYDQGVFTGFIWTQDDADEFQRLPTGHDLLHTSLQLQPGDFPAEDLQSLVALPREGDILYIPYLHYSGLVSASLGIVTGTSRFGALLLKADGSIAVPFNVRLTEKLGDLFGSKLKWLSRASCAYNTSNTYDNRNPIASVVPCLMCCQDVVVEISNSSY